MGQISVAFPHAARVAGEERTSNTAGTYSQAQLDIKSSRVFTTVVAVSIICFISLVGNYFLWQSKQQYKDDALKFRIIRVWRGCSPKEILWLNDVFDIHRNEKIIKLIKEKADDYDMELKQKADSLMQKKLK